MNDTMFVRTQCHGGVFFLQEHWQQLVLVLLKDSICRFYTLSFEINNMLRIDEQQDKYQVVLHPLLMG
jgi:hypothetical protein